MKKNPFYYIEFPWYSPRRGEHILKYILYREFSSSFLSTRLYNTSTTGLFLANQKTMGLCSFLFPWIVCERHGRNYTYLFLKNKFLYKDSALFTTYAQVINIKTNFVQVLGLQLTIYNNQS